MKFFKFFLVLLFVSISVGSSAEELKTATKEKETKKENEIPKEYSKWLEDLQNDLRKQGISKETLKKAFEKNYYQETPEVVALDRKQPEFVWTTTDYLNRLINQKRVNTARVHYKDFSKKYAKLETEYGVPLEYLISFWGLETNFGSTFGGFEVIEALVHLSYDTRRPTFFRKELFEALKIMQKYDFETTKMAGSWAGAMGHFQFMPSTFNQYAIDYDKDSKIDIWDSFDDAIASAANYLSKMGWKKDEPWGIEISLNYNFNYDNLGLKVTKSIKEWNRLGVRSVSGNKLLETQNLNGSVILPEGQKGKAYLVFDNYKKIMRWNRSENYALAIGKLSDYTRSDIAYKVEPENLALKLKTEDILLIQRFINNEKIAVIDEDGLLGSRTRLAIRKLQKQAMLPDDGYPSYRLIRKVKRFDTKLKFAVPVQPQKPEK